MVGEGCWRPKGITSVKLRVPERSAPPVGAVPARAVPPGDEPDELPTSDGAIAGAAGRKPLPAQVRICLSGCGDAKVRPPAF